jgi:hypothetical protein
MKSLDRRLKTGTLLRYSFLYTNTTELGLLLNVSNDHNFGAILIVLANKEIIKVPLLHINYEIIGRNK